MGYILKQYNHIVGDGSNDEYDDPHNPGQKLNYFLNPIPFSDEDIKEYTSEGFKGAIITYESDNSDPGFEAGGHYYFHGLLHNGYGNKYNIKLIDDSDSLNKKEQFIKTISTPIDNGFVDVEFIFTPVINFSKLVFDLDRTNVVGGGFGHTIHLGVFEISLINNIMGTKLAMTSITSNVLPPILKAGIQSRPGLLLCINGEDIRLPHNGIYEIKNGVILVDFFSVVTPFVFDDSVINNWKNSPYNKSFYPLDSLNPNRRKTSGFTIDYLYYLAIND